MTDYEIEYNEKTTFIGSFPENITFQDRVNRFFVHMEDASFFELFIVIALLHILFWMLYKTVKWLCYKIPEAIETRSINKAIVKKFRCSKNSYVLLEPTDPGKQEDFYVLALDSGLSYLVAISDHRPYQIVFQEELESIHDR